MCDCHSHVDKTYTDHGTYWDVVETCTKCGKVVKQYTEPKIEGIDY